jgi:hypothetical protein
LFYEAEGREYQPELLLQADDIAQVVMASLQNAPHTGNHQRRDPAFDLRICAPSSIVLPPGSTWLLLSFPKAAFTPRLF